MSWHFSLAMTCFAFSVFALAVTWFAGYRKGQKRNRFRHYGSVLPKPRREAVIGRDSEWLVARPSGYFPLESTPFGLRDTTTGCGV